MQRDQPCPVIMMLRVVGCGLRYMSGLLEPSPSFDHGRHNMYDSKA